MITIEQAKKAALDYTGAGLEISEASELPDKWVFSFRNAKTKEEPDIAPVSVSKEDGVVAEFFPPEHLAELPLMKPVEV